MFEPFRFFYYRVIIDCDDHIFKSEEMVHVLVFLFCFGETSKLCFWSIRFSRRFLFPVLTVILIFMCNKIGSCSEKMIRTWDIVFDVWYLFIQKSLSSVSGPPLMKSTTTYVCMCLIWQRDFVLGLQCLWKRRPPQKSLWYNYIKNGESNRTAIYTII